MNQTRLTDKEAITFLIFFVVMVGCILFLLITAPIAKLEEKYRDGYLRGQTDAIVRKWNNIYLDTTELDKKEWRLKIK